MMDHGTGITPKNEIVSLPFMNRNSNISLETCRMGDAHLISPNIGNLARMAMPKGSNGNPVI